MVVTCTLCGIKFKINETLFKGDGAKVRCFKCKHIFKVYQKPKGSAALPRPPLKARSHPRKPKIISEPFTMGKTDAEPTENHGARPRVHDGAANALGSASLSKTRSGAGAARVKPGAKARKAPVTPDDGIPMDSPGLKRSTPRAGKGPLRTPAKPKTRPKTRPKTGGRLNGASKQDVRQKPPTPEEDLHLDFLDLEISEPLAGADAGEKPGKPEPPSGPGTPFNGSSDSDDDESTGMSDDEFTLEFLDLKESDPLVMDDEEEKTGRPETPSGPGASDKDASASDVDEPPGMSDDGFTLPFQDLKKSQPRAKEDAEAKNAKAELPGAELPGAEISGAEITRAEIPPNSGASTNEGSEAGPEKSALFGDDFKIDFLDDESTESPADGGEAKKTEKPEEPPGSGAPTDGGQNSDLHETPAAFEDEFELDFSHLKEIQAEAENAETPEASEIEFKLDDSDLEETRAGAESENGETPGPSEVEFKLDDSDLEETRAGAESENGETSGPSEVEFKLDVSDLEEIRAGAEPENDEPPAASGIEFKLDDSDLEETRAGAESENGETPAASGIEFKLDDFDLEETRAGAESENDETPAASGIEFKLDDSDLEETRTGAESENDETPPASGIEYELDFSELEGVEPRAKSEADASSDAPVDKFNTDLFDLKEVEPAEGAEPPDHDDDAAAAVDQFLTRPDASMDELDFMEELSLPGLDAPGVDAGADAVAGAAPSLDEVENLDLSAIQFVDEVKGEAPGKTADKGEAKHGKAEPIKKAVKREAKHGKAEPIKKAVKREAEHGKAEPRKRAVDPGLKKRSRRRNGKPGGMVKLKGLDIEVYISPLFKKIMKKKDFRHIASAGFNDTLLTVEQGVYVLEIRIRTHPAAKTITIDADLGIVGNLPGEKANNVERRPDQLNALEEEIVEIYLVADQALNKFGIPASYSEALHLGVGRRIESLQGTLHAYLTNEYSTRRMAEDGFGELIREEIALAATSLSCIHDLVASRRHKGEYKRLFRRLPRLFKKYLVNAPVRNYIDKSKTKLLKYNTAVDRGNFRDLIHALEKEGRGGKK